MTSYQIHNVPPQGTLNEFRSLASSQGDFARIARYAVQIRNISSNIVAERDLMLLCDSAEFPTRAFNADEVRYYGPNFKLPYQSSYIDVTLSFLCRSEMREKEMFDTWMEVINPKSTYDFSYRKTYATDIDIYQYTELGDPSYKVTLRHAYPLNVNAMPLNWAEDNFQRVQVQFAYTDWITPNQRESSDYKIVNDSEVLAVGGSALGYKRIR